MREEGIGVRLSTFLALPGTVSVNLEGSRFRAAVRLFGLTIKTLLDIDLRDIEIVRVRRLRWIGLCQVVSKNPQMRSLTFEPSKPRLWVEAFREAGVQVEDLTAGRFLLNRAVHIYSRTILTIAFVIAVLIGV